MDDALRSELLEMGRLDQDVRRRLAEGGDPFGESRAEMRRLQEIHGRRLQEIVEQHGWPGRSLVGDDGENAAWLLCQHAVSMPALMRRCRDLVEKGTAIGEAPARQFAYLDDRIRMFEGRPQRYGTQFDSSGEPHQIEDPEGLDDRRRSVGLGPFSEYQELVRSMTPHAGASAPRSPGSADRVARAPGSDPR